MSYIGIIISYIFVTNVILARFLGLCPFIGVSRDLTSAIGMGFAVTFVLSLSSLFTSVIFYFILIPLGLVYMKIITFIIIIASLVQLVEMIIHKYSPGLYKSLGIYLPLITTNCAVLGVAFWNVDVDKYDIMESFVAGIAAGIGFTVAIVLMASIRERLDLEKVPRYLQGAPIAFISGGLMALGFYAFDQNLLNNIGFGK